MDLASKAMVMFMIERVNCLRFVVAANPVGSRCTRVFFTHYFGSRRGGGLEHSGARVVGRLNILGGENALLPRFMKNLVSFAGTRSLRYLNLQRQPRIQ